MTARFYQALADAIKISKFMNDTDHVEKHEKLWKPCRNFRRVP